MLILGLILFKKNKEVWETPDDYSLSSGLSAKKVIFDDDSNQNVLEGMEVESMEEIEGRLVRKGNKVSNEYEVKGEKNLGEDGLYFMENKDEDGSEITDPMKI